MNQWCILRCKGGNTLKLAASLVLGGIPAWTPIETIKRRPPRSKTWERKDAPVLPTFVFADAMRLPDLIRLSESWISPHPDFSVFRHYDRFPLIDDRELSALRHAERKGTPIDRLPQFNTGDRVKLEDGGFAGLTGIIERADGKFALVAFPGFAIPVKIGTLHLALETGNNPATPAGMQAA